ncbi:conserved hypothetical protein [Paecilomyces variotii No. 5]|uniref:Uncharacterized protein n=1 Tax=Byssochlamys spectabilis (strain No. 5 / NBRC 109023) TaxID=1356009 RepID=V5I2F9_BYSSN|nr:conserved hypothetical protein [Paecilomyces variotii No. 5]
MFRFPKFNRFVSAFWSPRGRRIESLQSSEDPGKEGSSGNSKEEEEEEVQEWKDHDIISAQVETAGFESKATNDGSASQLFTPAGSSQKKDIRNIQDVTAYNERCVNEDNGNFRSQLLSISRMSGPENDGSHGLPTPATKGDKGDDTGRGYALVKAEKMSDDGNIVLEGYDERCLPDEESPSSRTSRRKRKRGTGSDSTSSNLHTVQSNDRNGDYMSLQGVQMGPLGDYHYHTLRRRATGRQPGLVPGTWLETDENWSEGELSNGYVRHNTPISISNDRMSIVSSKASGRSKNTKPNLNDEAYRPSPATSNKSFRKSIVKIEIEDMDDPGDEDLWSEKNTGWDYDKSEISFDFSAERAKRWAQAVELPPGKWAEAEKDLFFRLSMRGFEPIIPDSWHLDFPTLPGSLFAVQGGPAPLVQVLNGTEFHAIKYLGDLLSLGCRVRDRVSVGLRPEPIIKRTIQKYINWAERDAQLNHCNSAIPVYHVYCMKKGESTRAAIQMLEKGLISTGEEYQEILQTESFAHSDTINYYPVITGFLVCGPIVAVITLNSASEAFSDASSDTFCKLISQFDFGDDGQDVWNALAIALTVIRIRKTMLELAEKGRGGWLLPPVNCIQSIEDEDL